MTRTGHEGVLHYLLAAHAGRQPEKPFLTLEERTLTYGQVESASNRLARGLARLGVVKGERVVVMMPNGIDMALVWFALCKLGAVMVPMNQSYRGGILLHQVNNCEPAFAVLHSEFVALFHELRERLTPWRQVVLCDADDASIEQARQLAEVHPFETLFKQTDAALPQVVEIWDPMAVMYTSGTTGLSKGVLYGHGQAYAAAVPMAGPMSPDDILYSFSPMHHVALPVLFGAALMHGASIALRPWFSVQHFWPDIRRYRATTVMLLGAVANFVYRQPPRQDDRNHALRKVMMVPLMRELDDFRSRFDCQVFTWFNMTEVNTPIHSDGFHLVNGRSCGRVRPGTAARLVDAHDEPVAVGQVGELVLRTDAPWELNLGYWNMPQETLEAFRNQWFHTGDLFTQDAGGNFYYVDRLKDAIRRRGENISSFEVETEINQHSAVLESAAVAVPADDSEDEIKVTVVLKPGAALGEAELISYLEQHMPLFMIPRYLHILDEPLQKTPTGKIRKGPLREAGIAGCWDRFASVSHRGR
jgi:crotonobetaine/carnitine-CoA ligase